MKSFFIAPPEVADRANLTIRPWCHCVTDAVAASVRLHRWGLGFRQSSFSPYRAGLAGRHLQRLPVAPAFLACSFPLQLSLSGKPDDPGTFLRVPPDCVRDSTPRSAAHALASSGSYHPANGLVSPQGSSPSLG